jgi:hypothetical protein
VEKIGSVGLTNYPILMKTNYNQWAQLMRIKLEAHGLWGVVDPSDAKFHVDRMALDAICSAVSAEMITVLATKDLAMEAWESIRMIQISDDCIRKASAQKVRREYEVLDFHDGEGVEGFAMRLKGMVNQLIMLGDPELDGKVILKYLWITHPRLKQLVMEPVDRVGKVTTTGVASGGIGPRIAGGSNPRRIKMNRHSRPKRRSQRFSMPRLNLRSHQPCVGVVATCRSQMEMRVVAHQINGVCVLAWSPLVQLVRMFLKKREWPHSCRVPSASPAEQGRKCTSWKRRCLQLSVNTGTSNHMLGC